MSKHRQWLAGSLCGASMVVLPFTRLGSRMAAVTTWIQQGVCMSATSSFADAAGANIVCHGLCEPKHPLEASMDAALCPDWVKDQCQRDQNYSFEFSHVCDYVANHFFVLTGDSTV